MNTEGVPLFARKPDGTYVSSIATLFPRHKLLITGPPIHALQRLVTFPEWFRKEQARAGRLAPNQIKLDWESRESVDLILDAGDVVLIRPEVERMDLALAADELLQTAYKVPKHRVRFLWVNVPRVRQVLREHGELWRISTPPSDPDQIPHTIRNSRVAIQERALYYYNRLTGTRWVTLTEFAGLAALEDAALARQMAEIAEHCLQRNRHGYPEVDFFGVDPRRFGSPLLVGLKPATLDASALRARHAELVERFREATEEGLRKDDVTVETWRKRMFAAITSAQRDDAVSEVMLEPSVERLLKVRWLPGGRFEDREFIVESIFPKPDHAPDDVELMPLWDPLARGFIGNFIREYGDVEYLNLGRVEIPTTALASYRGRRGVYLAELKVRGEDNPRVLFLRLQRWGIRERLMEKDEQGRPKDLVRAVFETEEYVDYTLDRRLGCLQFGMRLPFRVHMRRVTERYTGSIEQYRKRAFPVIYFERDYLPGIPTDKLPSAKLNDPEYARTLARLLGRAAAPNIVVGRTQNPEPEDAPGEVLFDDGDEIIVEGSDGLPREVVLVDHGGAFADWRTPSLLPFAKAYAGPVNRRKDQVQDPKEFAEIYLRTFQEEFDRLQSEYRRLPAAFDNLFKHLPYSEKGSFACRWEQILRRLGATDLDALIEEIRRHIA